MRKADWSADFGQKLRADDPGAWNLLLREEGPRIEKRLQVSIRSNDLTSAAMLEVFIRFPDPPPNLIRGSFCEVVSGRLSNITSPER